MHFSYSTLGTFLAEYLHNYMLHIHIHIFSGRLQCEETARMLEELQSRKIKMQGQKTEEEIEKIQANFELALQQRQSSGPGASSPNPDAVSQLQIHCQKSHLDLPEYEEHKCGEQQFKYRVTIKKTYEGQVRRGKKEAKQSAAQAALARLKHE